jgi:hypothetical protein
VPWYLVEAASGQNWTGSVFMTLFGGSAANIINPMIWIEEVDSAGHDCCWEQYDVQSDLDSLAASRSASGSISLNNVNKQAVASYAVNVLSIGCSPWAFDGQLDGHMRRIRY